MTSQAGEVAGTHRGADTGSWWRLGRSGWRAVLKVTVREFKRDEVANLAAVVTLRLVLAIVPSVIAGVAIAAQVISPADIERLVDSTGGLIPGSAEGFVTDALSTALRRLQENGTIALVASIAVGLFAATGGAAALITALNRAYSVDEGRGFVRQRLAALGVVAALGVALAGLFVAIVLGPTLLELVLSDRLLDSPLQAFITVGRYVAAVAILMTFFGFTFWFGPHRDRPRLRFLTPGAVLGVAGWLLLSWLFGLYVSFSQSYAATYGAFAGLVVLIVWLNYSFIVLLMGAELDHEIELHLDATLPQGPPSDGGDEEDLDEVLPDMPRHPGLMGAGVARDRSRDADEHDDQHDDQHDDHATGGGRRHRGLPTPTLVGAAAATAGALVASRVWARLSR